MFGTGKDIYKLFFDRTPVLMGTAGFDGRISSANPAWEEQLGLAPAGLADRPFLDLVHPEDRAAAERTMKELQDGARTARFDARLRCADGGYKWFNTRLSADRESGTFSLVSAEITAHKLTEAALRESEATLRRIIDSAPMAMAIVAIDGAIEYINRKAVEVFGYPHSDIPTMERWWRLAYPDEGYREQVMETWMGRVMAAWEKKTEIPGAEFLVTCKDGSKKTCFIFGVIAAGKVFVMFDDVTARVRAADAVKEREATLRRILEQAPIAIGIHDLGGRVEFLNTKFRQMFGYSPEDLPDLDTWAAKAYPDAAYRRKVMEEWREWTQKSVKTGREMEGMTLRIVCRDGSSKTALLTGVVTADAKVLAVFDDITARAEAERALRESESLYRSLIETTGTGYVVLDGQGRVLDANREYVRLTGHPDLRDILGRHVGEWVAPASQDRSREALDLVRRDGRVAGYELDYLGAGGRTVTVEINATIVERNGVQQVLGLVRDVSARSKTEAHLRDSESLYRALVETTRTGYVVIDTEGRVVDANREYVRLTGHADLKEIAGRPVTDWTAPDLIADNAAAVAKCAREGHIFNYETDYIDRKGRRTPIEINATVVRRAGVPQIHTLCRDITERRRQEAELSAANVELTMEIAQRIDSEKAREKLQQELLQSQKMEVVGRLAGGIAHDFNNILVGISGYAELLLKNTPDGPQSREDINEILRETERGALLTRQLIAISRRQPLQLKVLDINAVVEDACRMLKRLVEANVHLEQRLDPGLYAVKADQGQVAQVILNLVINARDAMPDGGRIVLATANEEVAAAPAGQPLPPAPGSYAVLTVTDTGTGIAPEIAGEIFEPFFTTKPEGKGTGLGLSTVFGIVQQAKGGLLLTSGPGGASFKIYFPRTEEKA